MADHRLDQLRNFPPHLVQMKGVRNRAQTRPLDAGLLIGFGSIGRVHAPIIRDRYSRMAIVDVGTGAREQAGEAFPDASIAANLAELHEKSWNWDKTLAVIASWGPTHSAIFDDLADLGVRRILCEKPLAVSVRAGTRMVEVAQARGIALGTHHKLPYSGFVSGLRGLAAEHGLGEPQAIVAHGGAVGVVTNGLHYLDLAAELFECSAESVTSTVYGEPINPRSPDLWLYGGTAIWCYGDGRELTASFSNRSSVHESTVIYYRNAVAYVSRDLDVDIRTRNMDDVAKFPAVTRAGRATEGVFSGTVPGLVARDERIERLLNEIESGDVVTYPPVRALRTLEACIGALAAGRERSTFVLPLDPAGEIAGVEWPVS